MSTFSINCFLNEVILKGKNRRIAVSRIIKNDKFGLVENVNLINIKALTSEIGMEPSVRHGLFSKDKVKESMIILTDDALRELHTVLTAHFNTLEQRNK